MYRPTTSLPSDWKGPLLAVIVDLLMSQIFFMGQNGQYEAIPITLLSGSTSQDYKSFLQNNWDSCYNKMQTDAIGPSQDFRLKIKQISDDLGQDEVQTLKYLCSDNIPYKKLEDVNSGLDLFDILCNKNLVTPEDTNFLAECLYHLRRVDLLKGYLQLDLQTVERVIEVNGAQLNPFHVMIMNVLQNMERSEVQEFGFCVSEYLPKKHTQYGTSGYGLMTALERVGRIAPDDVDLLENIISKVADDDALKVIKKYKSARRSVEQPHPGGNQTSRKACPGGDVPPNVCQQQNVGAPAVGGIGGENQVAKKMPSNRQPQQPSNFQPSPGTMATQPPGVPPNNHLPGDETQVRPGMNKESDTISPKKGGLRVALEPEKKDLKRSELMPGQPRGGEVDTRKTPEGGPREEGAVGGNIGPARIEKKSLGDEPDVRYPPSGPYGDMKDLRTRDEMDRRDLCRAAAEARTKKQAAGSDENLDHKRRGSGNTQVEDKGQGLSLHSRLGNTQVEEELKRGGMGTVEKEEKLGLYYPPDEERLPTLLDQFVSGPPDDLSEMSLTGPSACIPSSVGEMSEGEDTSLIQAEDEFTPNVENARNAEGNRCTNEALPEQAVDEGDSIHLPNHQELETANNSMESEDQPQIVPGPDLHNTADILKMEKELEKLRKELDSRDNDMPSYHFSHDPRGICVIINNVKFKPVPGAKQLKDRPGSDMDAGNLEYIFDKLKFNVDRYDNLTREEMVDVVVKYAIKVDHTAYDCFVCCILTHGAKGQVYGIDGRAVEIFDLTNYFKGLACKSLRAKPKLFFIQACQGNVNQLGFQTDSDASDPSMLPNEADFLLSFATLPGFVSYRSETHGSWFITMLVEMLDQYSDRHDLLSILIKVNEEVSKASAHIQGGIYKQSPMPMPTLRKKVFLKA